MTPIDTNTDRTLDAFPELRHLRDAGFVVVVFYPEELGTAPPRQVEDAMIGYGWDIIDTLQTQRMQA